MIRDQTEDPPNYLYVILDVFSRYVVGWMVADGESSRTGQTAHCGYLWQTGNRAGEADDPCGPGFLHDLQPVAFLMADLGITKTHSRPYVSDDNPYSESHFRP